MNPKVEVVVDYATHLGEGPHWCPERQQLFYVDIFRQYVHRYDPKNRTNTKVHIEGGPVTLVVPIKNKDKYVISRGRELAVMDWNGTDSKPSNVKPVLKVDDWRPTNRFNDGKCDASGRLWAGTMGCEKIVGQLDEKKGSLYSIDKDWTVKKHLEKIDISNGLAWSADNKTMYYIDSKLYRVDAYDFDIVNGTMSNPRVIYDFKKNETEGLPDGMTIDATGKLWVACFFGGKIIYLDPEVGKLVQTVKMPCSNITSVMFGGPNLDIMYATCAQHGLGVDELGLEPTAGSLFQITGLGVKGTSATNFTTAADDN